MAAQANGGLGRDTTLVAGWTLASRVTGLLRVVVIGAVLGPTFFGNVFQSTNLLPNLVFEFLTGSLFASILVPPMVSALDRGDPDAAERLAGGFLGVVLLGFAGIAALVVGLGPLILRVLGWGVTDDGVAANQQRVGMVLLVLVMPQLLCYGIAGTCAAAMNARGRFALAAGAPALENVGLIVTMVLSAMAFGVGRDLGEVSTAQLLLLGGGATASVALHAAAQWFGAYRAGLTLRPRAGWRDPDVCRILASSRATLGQSGLNVLRVLLMLVVANSVAGGVVVVSLARNFANVAVGLLARPVATALLPRLSRLHTTRAFADFRATFDRGASASAALVLPAAVLLLVLALPLSRAVAFGEMSTPRGVSLVAVSLAAVALGAVGDAAFILGSTASYAREDARAPLRAMIVRAVVSAAGMALAFSLEDEVRVLLMLGLSMAAGDLLGGGYLCRQAVRGLPRGSGSLPGSVLRGLIAGGVAGTAGWATSQAAAMGGMGDQVVIVVAGLIALLSFAAVHALLRSPEMSALRDTRRSTG